MATPVRRPATPACAPGPVVGHGPAGCGRHRPNRGAMRQSCGPFPQSRSTERPGEPDRAVSAPIVPVRWSVQVPCRDGPGLTSPRGRGDAQRRGRPGWHVAARIGGGAARSGSGGIPASPSGDDTSLIVHAAEMATVAHAGQLRRSGEPYVTHPIAVAGIVADLGLDAQTVAAALLHDAVEDTGVTTEVIERDFGPAVALIVEGVTKLDRLQFDSKEAQQAATVRKMLVAMANDWRVLIIKLADRLHNMRTLSVMPEWKQRRTAQETLDIYAPLAHRLGIEGVKWQLEDLSFATLHPKRYAEIEQMVASRAPLRDEFLARVLVSVRERLVASGVNAEVTGRPKHLWSIYEKMVVRGKEFDELYDLLGIRVIVESEKDCWAALGSIHAIWPPVQGRFKDYINSPKFNLYQSLHTTVIGLDGKPIEVQVRTHEMHRRAEYGIAAHWGYKEGTQRDPGVSAVRADGTAGPATKSKRAKDGDAKEKGSKKASPDDPGPAGRAGRAGSPGRAPGAGQRDVVDHRRDRVDAADRRLPERDDRSDRVPRGAEARPRGGRGLRVHPEGQGHRPGGQLDPGRLRLQHPHRSRPQVHRRQGERPTRPARHPAELGRHGGDLHLQVGDRGPVPRLAAHGGLVAGPLQDPPVVLAGAPRGCHRARPRRADQGAAPRGTAGPEAGLGAHAGRAGQDHELRRRRCAARRHRRQPDLGAGGHPADPARAAGRDHRGAAAGHRPPAADRLAARPGARRSGSTSRDSTT